MKEGSEGEEERERERGREREKREEKQRDLNRIQLCSLQLCGLNVSSRMDLFFLSTHTLSFWSLFQSSDPQPF